MKVKFKEPSIFALSGLDKCSGDINVRSNEYAVGNFTKLISLFCEIFYK
jgi:hypothetical protein